MDNETPAASVLIVDDDSAVRQMVMRSLARNGLKCDAACNGDEALAMVGKGSYSVVVTDLRMPNVNGHTLCVELLTRPNPPAVVVITGVVEPRLETDLRARGVAEVLLKPLDLRRLAAGVRNLVEAQQEQQHGHRSSTDPAGGPPDTLSDAGVNDEMSSNGEVLSNAKAPSNAEVPSNSKVPSNSEVPPNNEAPSNNQVPSDAIASEANARSARVIAVAEPIEARSLAARDATVTAVSSPAREPDASASLNSPQHLETIAARITRAASAARSRIDKPLRDEFQLDAAKGLTVKEIAEAIRLHPGLDIDLIRLICYRQQMQSSDAPEPGRGRLWLAVTFAIGTMFGWTLHFLSLLAQSLL